MHDRCGWHLCSLFLLVVSVSVGVWIFSLGFLLSRVELPETSRCPNYGTGATTCYPDFTPTFQRAVVIVVDALMYQFLVTQPDLWPNRTKTFENKLPEVAKLLRDHPDRAALFKFIADPPTTTMQRIKALTTGSLPTFVDVSNNFAAASIQEDNIIIKFNDMGKRVTFLGDDTWMQLFPDTFDLKFPYPSFDVRDLDTVDRGVVTHLFPEIKRNTSHLFIAHFLGVDHCGHRYGRDHPAMARKLGEVNGIIQEVARIIGPDTVMFVMGDHGMTKTGDHGGDSLDEVEAGLFVYSKTPFIDVRLLESSIAQVDFVPTLSLLLGHPIPFSNLGHIIPAFFSAKNQSSDATDPRLLQALQINADQVSAFLRQYSNVSSDLKGGAYDRLMSLYSVTQETATLENYLEFFRATFHTCRSIWAKFDNRRMAVGVIVLGSTVAGAVFIITMVSDSGWMTNSFAIVSIAISIGHFVSMFSNSFEIHEDVTVSCIMQAFICIHFIQSCYQRGKPSWLAILRWLLLMLLIRSLEVVRRCREEQSECAVSPFAVNIDALSDEHLIKTRRALSLVAPTALGFYLARLKKRMTRPNEWTSFLPFLFTIALIFIFVLKCVTFKSPETEFLTGMIMWGAVGAMYLLLFLYPVFIQTSRPRALNSAEDTYERSRRPAHHFQDPPQEIYELHDSVQISAKLFAVPVLLLMIVILGDTWAMVTVSVLVLARFHFADATPVMKMTAWAFLSWQLFFLSGHQTTFPTLHWMSAFAGVGADGAGSHWSKVILMAGETFSGQILAAIAIPSLMSVGGDVFWLKNPHTYWRTLWLNCLGYLIWHASKLFLVMMNAAMNRRHLMVWKIFAPRFIFEAGSFGVTGLFVLFSYLYSAYAFYATVRAVVDLQVPLEQYTSKRTKDLSDKISRKRR